MNPPTEQNIFHPYKVIHQGRSTLQLQPGIGQKTGILILRIMPLFMLAIGVILYITQKEIMFLVMFGGFALIEALIFSFVKIPAAISMDNIGFTLETLSIKGAKEAYYLWSDVDVIRNRIIRSKKSTTLAYEAVLKTGKRVSFLNFGNYYSKQNVVTEINAMLTQISGKEIVEK